jgi:hypothetical protein
MPSEMHLSLFIISKKNINVILFMHHGLDICRPKENIEYSDHLEQMKINSLSVSV